MITDKIYLALSVSQKDGDPLLFVRDPCEGLGRPLALSVSQKDGEPLVFLPEECTGISLQTGKIYLGIQYGFTDGDPLVFIPCCGDEEPPCVGARVNFSVSGCRGGLNGAVCTVTKDAYTDSCTTATSLSLVDGYCTINMGAADIGTYNYEITHPSGRFQTATGTFDLTAGSCVANVVVTLEPASGYHCTPCCNLPLPITLYLDDKFGVTELTLSTSGIGLLAWSGCNPNGPTSAYHIETVGASPPYTCEVVLGGLGDSAVFYDLYCSKSGDNVSFALHPAGGGCGGGITTPPGVIFIDCDQNNGATSPCGQSIPGFPGQLVCFPTRRVGGPVACDESIDITFEIPSFILNGDEQCDGGCDGQFWAAGDTFVVTE